MSALALSVVGPVEARACALCSLRVQHVQHRIYAPRPGGFETGTLWLPVPHEGPCGLLCSLSPNSADYVPEALHGRDCAACAPLTRWFGGDA